MRVKSKHEDLNGTLIIKDKSFEVHCDGYFISVYHTIETLNKDWEVINED